MGNHPNAQGNELKAVGVGMKLFRNDEMEIVKIGKNKEEIEREETKIREEREYFMKSMRNSAEMTSPVRLDIFPEGRRNIP